MLIRVIEITAIPVGKLFSQEAKQALQHILRSFQAFLNQFHVLSGGQSTSIEFMFLSGESSDHIQQNPIRLLSIIRGDVNSLIMNNLVSAITSQLKANHYLTKEFTQSEADALAAIITDISSHSLLAVVKTEKLVTSNLSYTGYYYYADMLLPSDDKPVDDFSALLNNMQHSPRSYLSFQLMPVHMQPQEEYALRDLSNALEQTVRGIYFQGEMIKEPYASAPYECYSYYTHRIGQPIFLYNILIASSASPQPLAAQILSSIKYSTKTQVNVEALEINPVQQIQFNFDLYPWQLSNLLQQYYRDPYIWNGNIVAPTNLSRLPFLVTAEEATVFFRLPIDDGNIIGIDKNPIMDSTELLRDSVVNNDNIVFGSQKSNPSISIDRKSVV